MKLFHMSYATPAVVSVEWKEETLSLQTLSEPMQREIEYLVGQITNKRGGIVKNVSFSDTSIAQAVKEIMCVNLL